MSGEAELRPSERPADWTGPRVLDWNDHAGAVSLTFDDACPSQLSIALPELGKRGLKATFFLVADSLMGDELEPMSAQEKSVWREVFSRGHELGHHSLRHRNPEAFSEGDYRDEVSGAADVLERDYGVRPASFAYPYVIITPRYKELLTPLFVAARGGRELLTPACGEPDWMDVPSVCALTDTPAADYLDRLRQAARDDAWCVFMIHAVEGDPWGWQPLPLGAFRALLDGCASGPWLWTDTFGAVASYLRAQKTCEAAGFFTAARPAESSGIWKWGRPRQVPAGVTLKMKLGGSRPVAARVSQRGQALYPDGRGVYALDFDAGELQVDIGAS